MDGKNNNFNELLIGIDSKVNLLGGEKLRSINFDNAATTPPFKSVVENIINSSEFYGSIGRGMGQKAEITTGAYNQTRDYLLDFFNIKEKDKYIVIYVNNTTDGVNKLARTLIHHRDEVVIATRMEHHSNDLPWRRQCKVDYVEVDYLGRLKIDDFERKLIHHKGKVKYVTITGASNVAGYLNDIHRIAKVTHKYQAKIIVDGAQLVPHVKVDMRGESKEESIDYLVFSGHKLYAPFGCGVIIGLRDEFDRNLPDNEGGGTVNFVMDKKVDYLLSPERAEGGTPNFFGAIAISRALRQLDEIGFNYMQKNERQLRDRLLEGLKAIPKVINYGDINNREDRLGIAVFNIESLNHQEVADILAKRYGISVRQGWFCAHPYCRRIMNISKKSASVFMHNANGKMPGMVRVSFGIYNEEGEIDYFLNVIESIVQKNY